MSAKTIGLMFYLKYGFLFLFLLLLAIHIISLGIRDKDVGIIVKELGKEFMSPLQNVQNVSIQIIQNKGYESKGILDSISTYGDFFFNGYKIYIWLNYTHEKLTPNYGINNFT